MSTPRGKVLAAGEGTWHIFCHLCGWRYNARVGSSFEAQNLLEQHQDFSGVHDDPTVPRCGAIKTIIPPGSPGEKWTIGCIKCKMVFRSIDAHKMIEMLAMHTQSPMCRQPIESSKFVPSPVLGEEDTTPVAMNDADVQHDWVNAKCIYCNMLMMAENGPCPVRVRIKAKTQPETARERRKPRFTFRS